MRKDYFNEGGGLQLGKRLLGAEERNGSQEAFSLAEDDALLELEREAAVELGGADNKYGADALLKEIKGEPPSRMALLMRRVAERAKALRDLRLARSQSWPADREPDELWRALADEALGIIGEDGRRRLDERRLLQSMPESERDSFRALCDSRRALAVFRDGFESEREAWERAYWGRALDESFGKRPWTGPAGSRSPR